MIFSIALQEMFVQHLYVVFEGLERKTLVELNDQLFLEKTLQYSIAYFIFLNNFTILNSLFYFPQQL